MVLKQWFEMIKSEESFSSILEILKKHMVGDNRDDYSKIVEENRYIFDINCVKYSNGDKYDF